MQYSSPSGRLARFMPCLVLAGSLIFLPGVAMGKKVVVLDFEGKGHKLVRTKLVEKIIQAHEIVDRGKVASEAKKLGLGTECNETNIMGVASVFSAEGVICGEIIGSGDKRQLKISVNNGGDAQEVASFTVPVGKWGLDTKALKQVTAQIDAALAKTWSWDTGGEGGGEDTAPAAEPTPEPAPEPEPEADGEMDPPPPPPPEPGAEEYPDEDLEGAPDPAPLEESEPTPEEKGVSVASADDGEDPLARSRPAHMRGKPAVTAKKKKKEESGRVDGNHALRLAVGPAIRFMRFYDPQGLDPSQKDSELIDKGYQPGIAAGLAIDAEFFPGAWLSDGIASYFGIGLIYNFINGPSWLLQTSSPGNIPLSHTSRNHELAVNARFRYQLLSEWYLPIITVKVGYHLMIYDMNEGEQTSPFPDMNLSSIGAGFALDQALWRDRLHAHFSYDFLYGLSFGEVTGTDYFGTAKSGMGHAIGGGFRGNIWGPIGYRLAVSYLRYSISFEHSSAPNSFKTWADRVRDQYVSGLVYLTFFN